jgi:hypothetical protein
LLDTTPIDETWKKWMKECNSYANCRADKFTSSPLTASCALFGAQSLYS